MTKFALADRKAAGAHYTPPELASFVARQLVTAWSRGPQRQDPRILDPAVGDGQLLVALLEALTDEGFRVKCVTGYDTDPGAVELAEERLRSAFPEEDIRIELRNFLDTPAGHERETQDLFEETSLEEYDLIITNPPYVRTQVLGGQRSRKLAERFGLSGRVDLYHVFVKLYEGVLQQDGFLGAILSNRFMMTKGGADTRRLFLTALPPLAVWDLGDTKLFDAAVLPAVVLSKKTRGAFKSPRFVSVYQSDPSGPAPSPEAVISAIETEGSTDGLQVRAGRLVHGVALDGVWRVETSEDVHWFSRVEDRTALRFKDVAPIRVGVKTTADSVFIRSNWNAACGDQIPELLRPLVTHHESQPIRPSEQRRRHRILYTHEIRGGRRQPVELSQYPRAAAYLEQHRDRLEGRQYVRKAGRHWFEIWVPQDPVAWDRTKVVFRDIADRPTFWLEGPGAVVNGDCYWLSPPAGSEEVLWLLLGVGNSSFALDFYDRRFQNRLYGGRRRFMTQYVEEFPLPNPDTEAARRIVDETRRLYDSKAERIGPDDLLVLDSLVYAAFGLAEEIGG